MSAQAPRYGGDQPAQASGIGETTDKQFKKPTQVVGQAPVVEGDALKETGPFDNIGAKPDRGMEPPTLSAGQDEPVHGGVKDTNQLHTRDEKSMNERLSG